MKTTPSKTMPPQDANTTDNSIQDARIANSPPAHSASSQRLRRDLHWALGGLLSGLIALPAAIYAVGASLLGPYDATSGGAAHIGSFYGDVFRGLATPTLAAWSIVLGPMVMIVLLRLILLPWPGSGSAPPAAEPTPEPGRREPFIGN
jgi:hypothetical protein